MNQASAVARESTVSVARSGEARSPVGKASCAADAARAASEIFGIHAAQTVDERRAASRLIERMYATRGYRAAPLPSADTDFARTIIACDAGAVVGTLTVGFDSDRGLLVDELFADEVGQYRKAGLGICEFTKLAMDRRARSPRLLASLFHVAYLLGHCVRGCRHLLIEVNPRHVRYYAAMLGFKVVGEPRHNPRVDAPAVLMALDLCFAQRQIATFGGSPVLAVSERSAYPYFFAPHEEAAMLARLQGGAHDIAKVLDLPSLVPATPLADSVHH